jgi:ribonucleoside-diphosphate reductase beta chain
LESIVPTEKRNIIYDFWRTDTLLFERCEFISSMYQKFVDTSTEESYFEALMANFILEGLYFYSGFCFFYSLSSRMLMSGSADIFRMINR